MVGVNFYWFLALSLTRTDNIKEKVRGKLIIEIFIRVFSRRVTSVSLIFRRKPQTDA